MSNIPEEIKQKIADLADKYSIVPAFSNDTRKDESRQLHFIAGGLAGYSLAQKELEEKEISYKRLSEQLEFLAGKIESKDNLIKEYDQYIKNNQP